MSAGFVILGGVVWLFYLARMIGYATAVRGERPLREALNDERFCAAKLIEGGRDATVTSLSGDQGVDVIAEKERADKRWEMAYDELTRGIASAALRERRQSAVARLAAASESLRSSISAIPRQSGVEATKTGIDAHHTSRLRHWAGSLGFMNRDS